MLHLSGTSLGRQCGAVCYPPAILRSGHRNTLFSVLRIFPHIALAPLVVALIVAFWPGVSNAHDETQKDFANLSIEELMEVEVDTVYSASRYAQKVTEAPSSISIITADDIKMFGYRTLADILRSVRGFYTTYDRTYAFLGVRGFSRPGDYNTRILVLINGHRINDNIYDQAPIGTEFPLDVDLIERVEVVRGPSSSLYGANAFLAMINVITRTGKDLGGFEVSGEYGSFDAYKTRLTVGKNGSPGWRLLVSGTLQESDGNKRLFFPEFNSSATNNGFAENLDHDRSPSAFVIASWCDFTLQGAYSQREKGYPTAAFNTVFNDPRARTIDEHYFLDLKYEKTLSADLAVMARASYNGYYYRGDYPLDYADYQNNPGASPFIVLNRDKSYGNWWGFEAQGVKTFFDRHKVTGGVEVRYNNRQSQLNFDTAPFTSYLNDRRTSTVWALYLQDEFRLLDNLSFYAGIRYDHYDTFGETFNPRWAVIYAPTEKTALKLLYGQAFRAPTAYELFYDDGNHFIKASPNLDAEKIRTWEVVWEQYLGDYLRSSVSGFYYTIDNLISQQFDPDDGLLQNRNIDQAHAKGAEFELEGKWRSGLRGRASYAYVWAENDRSGGELTNSPRHLAKLNLILPLVGDYLLGGVELQYNGKRKTLAGNLADDFFLTNLTLSCQKYVKGLEFSASIYNLFDRKYDEPGSNEHKQDLITQDGRTFRLKLTYRF